MTGGQANRMTHGVPRRRSTVTRRPIPSRRRRRCRTRSATRNARTPA
ncbi:hypothetical protein GS506_05330 [Rhodococcus hoagii]|nr:hypothetical protein [Prescottella equi]